MGPRARVTILLLVLCSVHAIRVPVNWNSDSAVTNEKLTRDVEIVGEANVPASSNPAPIPIEYFQYPAKKPQFAVDVAQFHGVQNPENHYTAYPVRPYTGKEIPVLGKHRILDENKPVFNEFQQFTKLNENSESSITPTSSDYEVFHPYKAEEPALEELYKDPVLDKIRNDIYKSQTRLQNYEKEAGKPDIQEDEYLESPHKTDRKKFPQKNVPVPYEIHRPQRRPIYYRPSPYTSRDQYLNRKFRHPWNQQNAKIRPLHYRPLRNHLQRLRQNHAIKYDDERNEYPQVPTHEQIAEVPEGYDIYERGKAKYVALRNNVDESINNAVTKHRPTTYQRLELENDGDKTITQIGDENEDEFIPVKNYAQVRKTETTKHLPKIMAFEDASTLDEIKNAPRLREAIKSTKAQTVYTEEGYEDAAYDHEGEEKHAAENEAHGGHLVEKEISGGKYKAPSVSQNYEDAGGSEYRDQLLHGEKWKDNNKENEQETEAEDYSEDDNAHSIEADIYDEVTGGRDKRQNESGEKKLPNNEDKEIQDKESDTETPVERSKRENKFDNETLAEETKVNDAKNEDAVHNGNNNFKIPEINLNSTFLTAAELAEKAKIKELPKKSDIQEKYPYYFKNLKHVSRDSPLKYAENLKFIPKKSKGGTEFYDSRSKILECPEVDDEVIALPEKFNKAGHPDESDGDEEEGNPKSGKADFSQIKNNQRLKGLGDKIDCFKAKFFGENPLDSPFFKEEIISNPEPVTAPNLPIYKLPPDLKEPLTLAASLDNVFNVSSKLQKPNANVTSLVDILKDEQRLLQDSLAKTREQLRSSLLPQNFSLIGSTAQLSQQSNVYSDVIKNINNLRQPLISDVQVTKQLDIPLTDNLSGKNVMYNSFADIGNVTKAPPSVRRKRAAPFIYEPYKIIRDGQSQESKKTTTTSNISPLIKQLQSSRVIDKVTKSSEEKEHPVKRNIATRYYKDIGRKDRVKIEDKGTKDSIEAKFVDVAIDSRRREPRYEVRLTNHKSQYAPVENKKSMSLEDYESQTNNTINRPQIQSDQSALATTIRPLALSTQKPKERKPTTNRPFFDVSQFLPKSITSDIQKPSASNTIRKVVKNPTPTEQIKTESRQNDDDEDYEEYEDEEEVTTTTTTTSKPVFKKRRPRTTTTTSKPEEEEEPILPKLRLITRFNSTPAPPTTTAKVEPTTEKSGDIESPKYREKKKKSSKSTLVTDTKSYGDDDDDSVKEQVDAMIGVQHDMEDYKPLYEKEIEARRRRPVAFSASNEEDDTDDEDSDEDDDEEFDDDDDRISASDEDDDSSSASLETEPEVTTPEPTKQTLVRTTEAPVSTTETRSAKLELRPIVHKKKIEIHKELPANKSLPHVTQYKQDYKEVEIIKEMPLKPVTPHKAPQRRPQKNLEALELYKDDKLAEEVNKLGAVEVFKENLDLVKGPKHGGNYRSIEKENTSTQIPLRRNNYKQINDAEPSQTKHEKLVELTDVLPARRANGRNRLRNSGRSARLELEEPSDSGSKRLHGGNLKLKQDTERGRERGKNAKLIELDEEDNIEDSHEDSNGRGFKMYDSSRSNSKPLHGGNYKSAKLAADTVEDETTTKEKAAANNHRIKSATLLSSFAQAVPHLTTTPAFILDPSKRMYYYVDAKR